MLEFEEIFASLLLMISNSDRLFSNGWPSRLLLSSCFDLEL